MPMKRIIRIRRLTNEEVAKYRQIRQQVESELPELIQRHYDRIAVLEQINELLRKSRS
jgi:hypothetical protein